MKQKKKMYPTYVSNHQSNREKQVILLMIPNKEKRMFKDLTVGDLSYASYVNYGSKVEGRES